MVATDRVSAFDVVLPVGIPHKGHVLNQLSAFWFEKTGHIVPNHLIEPVERAEQLEEWAGALGDEEALASLVGRSMIVRKAEPILIECVVRGYIAGSAWEEYRQRGTIIGAAVKQGLMESEQLAEPIFTPATKAESGHDENISVAEMARLVGKKLTGELAEISLALYRYAAEYALGRGIIIADTKFEFGLVDSRVILIDEALTPDSSRFWDVNDYAPGRSQPSFDKQYVRDWLTTSGWNREPPAPSLPPDVVEKTSEKYLEAYRRLTGRDIA